MKKFLVAIFFLSLTFCWAQTHTVKSVPNMKVLNNSYVSNPDNLISEATVTQINQKLTALEQQTTSQVAVVLLNSIGEETDFNFAQDLFKEWGIGKANKDNGLLILFIKDQRKIRLHTGFGLEGVLPDAICKRIETQFMVPHFKEGDVDAGIVAGVEEVNKILTDPKYAEEIKDDSSSSTQTSSDGSEQLGISFLGIIGWLVIGIIVYFSKRKSNFYNSPNAIHDVPSSAITSGKWWFWYYIFPIVVMIAVAFTTDWISYGAGLYAFVAVLGLGKWGRITKEANRWLEKKEYHAVHYFLSEEKKGILGMAIFFPIPYAFVWANLKKKIAAIRTTPRECNNCGKKCARLDEVTEDEYLSKESQFEEQLKSVDYDVWKCTSCGEVSLEAYINEKTEYSECPKCKTHAFYTASTTTKVSATTSHEGSREVVKSCKYCNHKTMTTETIPRIVVSSSDSSSSSSSGSSGGSFGGGDSGGGGASSSW